MKAHLLQGITGLNSSAGILERQSQNYALFVCLRLLKETGFFAVEAMRAVLRQVIVKRQGGAVSVLGAFSDFRVFWQGGRQIAL